MGTKKYKIQNIASPEVLALATIHSAMATHPDDKLYPVSCFMLMSYPSHFYFVVCWRTHPPLLPAWQRHYSVEYAMLEIKPQAWQVPYPLNCM